MKSTFSTLIPQKWASKSWLGLADYLEGRVTTVFECGIIDSPGLARDFEVDSPNLMRPRVCW